MNSTIKACGMLAAAVIGIMLLMLLMAWLIVSLTGCALFQTRVDVQRADHIVWPCPARPGIRRLYFGQPAPFDGLLVSPNNFWMGLKQGWIIVIEIPAPPDPPKWATTQADTQPEDGP